jgi:hypothetical protein
MWPMRMLDTQHIGNITTGAVEAKWNPNPFIEIWRDDDFYTCAMPFTTKLNDKIWKCIFGSYSGVHETPRVFMDIYSGNELYRGSQLLWEMFGTLTEKCCDDPNFSNGWSCDQCGYSSEASKFLYDLACSLNDDGQPIKGKELPHPEDYF